MGVVDSRSYEVEREHAGKPPIIDIREAVAMSWDLQTQLGELPPEQMAKYQVIERTMGETTVHLFPNLFTEDQQRYLTTPIMLVLHMAPFEQFYEHWKTRRAKKMLSPLGGKTYSRYNYVSQLLPTDSNTQQGGNNIHAPVVMGMSLVNGKIPVYLIQRTNTTLVDERFLQVPVEEDIDPLPIKPTIEQLQVYDAVWRRNNEPILERAENIKAVNATQDFAGVVVHEKIHGLQLLSMPKPIKEAQAAFFQRVVMRQFGYQNEGDPFIKAAEFYGQLVDQYGPDVHRVIFGTVSEEVTQDLLPKILQAFADNMDTIFPNIEGITEAVAV